MTGFQVEKDLVLEYYRRLDSAAPEDIDRVLAEFVAPNALWRGFHPFREMPAQSAGRAFWLPLRQALSRLQRRMDIFMAGENEIDDFQSVWVVSMGHLMGLFDAPWLGIPPTGKLVMLRYSEFNRVSDGKIVDTAMYFDIPHLVAQTGLRLFPAQTAAELVQPGPAPHDALYFTPQPEAEAKATLDAINAMIRDLGQWKLGIPLEEELARTWHDDMLWWGPTGIGSTYTIERYAKQHSGPFRAAFTERTKTRHICRMAEGHYGGFFGWPNFTATLSGPFMGLPATGKRGDFRVIDIYRREGNKLAENWIFIDLLHFWNQQGIDFLARLPQPGDD